MFKGKYIIYLDQNKWSDIMKTIDGTYQNSKYSNVVQIILEKVKNNEWIFPISYTHFNETLLWLNKIKRSKLTCAMDIIGNRYTMPSFDVVLKDEIIRAAQKKNMLDTYLYQGDLFAFTGSVLNFNFVDDEGNNKPELEQEFLSFLKSLNLYGIAVESDYFNIKETTSGNELMHICMLNEKEWFLKLPKKSRIEQFKLKVFRDFYSCMELNVLEDDILANDNKILNLIDKIKSFDVYVSLKSNLYQNIDGKIDINDIKDIYFLSVAIPFTDIVIGEKKWINVARSLKLGEKYNTILEKDLDFLMSV